MSASAEQEALEDTQVEMDIEEEEVVDEMKVDFDALNELASSSSASMVKLSSEYQRLTNSPRMDDVAIAIKEQCIYKLANICTSPHFAQAASESDGAQFKDILDLLQYYNDFFAAIPKAKTAKIVRNIIDIVSKVPDSLDTQIVLCRDVAKWCVEEKRNFLRQRIEAKLASLLLQKGQSQEALKLVSSLLVELKKLDDKQMLTEVHLTESRIYFDLHNAPKSKASLTASRTAANAIYVVPLLQAELDEMSGLLQCDEGDSTTAFSYFLEAFEAYDNATHERAVPCLKYMILCKILSESTKDVPQLLSGKHGLKHAGADLSAMAAVADAAKCRSLEKFQTAVETYSQYLRTDLLISRHLDILYDRMLEANLMKLIHPFSCVEVAHVAHLINLPHDVVEKKLSQMILDHKLTGILDQGKGHLIVYDSSEKDSSFEKGAEVVSNLGQVVETLFSRAKGLSKAAATATTTPKDKATAK